MTKTTQVVKVEVVHGRGDEEMLLDEFGTFNGNKENVFPNTPSRRGVPAISLKAPEENLRVPSPDVSTILSSTPHPSLSKSLNSKFNKLSESFSKLTTTPGPNPVPMFVRWGLYANGLVARRRMIILFRDDV